MKCINLQDSVTEYITKFIPDFRFQHYQSELVPVSDKLTLSENMFLLALGATGSGKTYFIKNIVESLPENTIVFLASPTKSLDYSKPYDGAKCQIIKSGSFIEAFSNLDNYLINRANSIMSSFIVQRFYNKTSSMEEIKLYSKYSKIYKELDHQYYSPDRRVFLILDDCAEEPRNNVDLFNDLVTKRRHLNVNIIVGCQSFTQVHPKDRRNISDLLLTSAVSDSDIKIVHESMNATCQSIKAFELSDRLFALFINSFNEKRRELGVEYTSWLFTPEKLYVLDERIGIEELTNRDIRELVINWNIRRKNINL